MSRLFAAYMGGLMLRSIGIAAIAGICSWKVRNVAIRHAIWVAVLAALLLLPILDYYLPASWVPVRVQQIASQQRVMFQAVSLKPAVIPDGILLPALPSAAVPVQTRPLDWWRVAVTLYLLVAVAMLV